MTDTYGDRTFGNAVDMSGPTPSWEQPADVLEGFDQFLALLPNFATPTVATSARELEPVKEESSAQTSVPAIEKMSSMERRLHKNKLAQKRFRDKQKARLAV